MWPNLVIVISFLTFVFWLKSLRVVVPFKLNISFTIMKLLFILIFCFPTHSSMSIRRVRVLRRKLREPDLEMRRKIRLSRFIWWNQLHRYHYVPLYFIFIEPWTFVIFIYFIKNSRQIIVKYNSSFHGSVLSYFSLIPQNAIRRRYNFSFSVTQWNNLNFPFLVPSDHMQRRSIQVSGWNLHQYRQKVQSEHRLS